MERVGTLINKLKEQFEQEADAAKMLVNTRLLLAELQTQLQQNPMPVKGKVSIVMPSFAQAPVDEPVVEKVVIATNVVEPEPIVEQLRTETVIEKEEVQPAWLFNLPVEIPTMVHQAAPVEKEVFELNELLVAQHEQPEINELLREDKMEVATALQSAPVRDLRKAVGINDRYLFVNELFRGDESMYERSMKTINGFSIFPEAQYWIERELKVKMGWDDQCEAVKLFDQLVRRRFS
jgi:hypothetical protein